MAAARSRSKKRSAANSTSPRPLDDDVVFFLDKCLGRVAIATALTAVGARIEIHTDHFPEEAPDAQWLPEVGRRGWVILTKDRHLLTNQLEIIALLRSGAAAFVLRAADMTGDEMAAAFVAALPTIETFLAKFPRPFLATVTRSGNVSILETYAGLIKRVE